MAGEGMESTDALFITRSDAAQSEYLFLCEREEREERREKRRERAQQEQQQQQRERK